MPETKQEVEWIVAEERTVYTDEEILSLEERIVLLERQILQQSVHISALHRNQQAIVAPTPERSVAGYSHEFVFTDKALGRAMEAFIHAPVGRVGIGQCTPSREGMYSRIQSWMLRE